MDIEFQVHLASFEESNFYDVTLKKGLDFLRDRFITDYSIEAISNLSIDEYVTGKGDKTTFCNRIESELKAWGNIKGGFATKFGVYYGKYGYESERKYRFLPKWGDTIEDAIISVKKEIVDLIKAGATKDYDKINKNSISPMLKGKILSLYYPNDFLNIFSSSHLDFFLNQLNITASKGISEIDKQRKIMQYKSSSEIMNGWNTYKFSRFLYYLFGSPTSDKFKGVLVEGLNKPKLKLFPTVDEVKYSIIEQKTKKTPIPNPTKINNTHGKVDFEKKNRSNKRLGDRGEIIVLRSEKDKLNNIGKKDLAGKIKHIALENDAAGYDILSYDENGDEIYIEVKSTRAKQGDANFYLTENELERAKGENNYWVYVVYEADTTNPKIWRIKNPFINNMDDISLVPVTYKVRIGVKSES